MEPRRSLLDPALLRALERLRVELRRRVERGGAGARRGQRHGASVEFAEHRAYVPGDDPRRIDWRAYARLGELVLRLYTAEHDGAAYLLLDGSASMAVPAQKFDRARTLAAALGYVALAGSDALSVALLGDGAGAGGRGGTFRGKGSVPVLLRALDELRPAGAAPLERAAEKLVRSNARPGLALLVSDLYDDEAALRAARRLALARFEVCAVHLLDDDELEPFGPAGDAARDGDYELRDAETGEVLRVTVDDEARALYAAERERFCAALERGLAARGARYVRAYGGRDALAVVAEAVARLRTEDPARGAPSGGAGP